MTTNASPSVTHSAQDADTPPHVLIIEDSPDDAELIERALRRAGLRFTAHRVETEADLLASLGAALPAIVLCDFHLPRLSCARAIEAVGKAGPAIPVMVVSRHIDDREAREVLRLGARAVLSKQRLGELAEAVRSAIAPPGS